MSLQRTLVALAAAGAVSAAPLATRLQTRAAPPRHRAGRMLDLSDFGQGDVYNNAQVGGWAGVVYNNQPNDTFVSAAATVVAPNASVPSGSDPNNQYGYGSSFWVGIWGQSGALWQAGFDADVQNGEVSYTAWYEWLPEAAINVGSDNLTINTGDEVYMEVTALSATSGNVTLINQSSGQSWSFVKDVTGTGEEELEASQAGWIVEDYGCCGGSIPFADFGTVTFDNSVLSLSNGTQVGLGAGSVLDMTNPDSSENQDVFATTAVNSDDSFTVTWVSST